MGVAHVCGSGCSRTSAAPCGQVLKVADASTYKNLQCTIT